MADVIAVTPDAAAQMQNMLTEAGQGAIGVRVGVAARGCSGLKYFMEYAKEVEQGDEVVEQNGVKILIDPASIMHMLGTTIYYVSDETEEGFKFDNPNVKSSCGCGESFSTDQDKHAGHSH